MKEEKTLKIKFGSGNLLSLKIFNDLYVLKREHYYIPQTPLYFKKYVINSALREHIS